MNKTRFLSTLGRTALVALLAGLSLSACTEARRALGYDKSAPDEFAVISRAPLSQPPDFSLRPPQPGAPRPQEGTTRDQAKNVLIPNRPGMQSSLFMGRSQGEKVILTKAGADRALPDIRRVVTDETTALADADSSFTDDILFWQKKPLPGEPVDAKKEALRLQGNAALGKTATEGDTPSIARHKKGWLEELF